MKKAICFLLYFCFYAVWAVAQSSETTFTGKVTTEEGKAMARVSCKLKDEKDNLLTYSFTNTEGKYTLKADPKAKYIEVTALGFATQKIEILAKKNQYNIVLQRKEIEMEEVTVKLEPMRRNKDTLLYNVDAFRKKSDKSIEDVIKNLPGISVSESGVISYQNIPINQVNIEGQNLMGSNYNLATQNMPAEAVTQIQLMERNQPIKALEGKVKSNRATLNIKLKKDYKLRPFGEVYGSIDTKLKRWYAKGNLMQIAPKNQMFVTAGTNNQGYLMGEIASSIELLSNEFTFEPTLSPITYTSSVRTPIYGTPYYMNNKTHYASINHLHAFSKESTLRTNILYYHNGEQHQDSIFHRYIGTDTISFYETKQLKTHNSFLRGALLYQLNSKKIYLNNELKGEIRHNKADNRFNYLLDKIQEYARRKPIYAQNTLSIILNTPNRVVNIASLAMFSQNTDWLYLPTDSFTQDINIKKWVVKNSIGTSFELFNNNLMVDYGMAYKAQQIVMNKAQESPLSNRYWQHKLRPVYRIDLSNGDIELSLPLEYVEYKDIQKGRTDRQLMFSPSIDYSVKFLSDYTANLTLAHNQETKQSLLPFKTLIAHNYRSISEYQDSLSLERASVATFSLSYLNTVSLLSWNFTSSFKHIKNDVYRRYLYSPFFTLSRLVWQDNDYTSWSLSYRIKKIWRNKGWTLAHNSDFSQSRSLHDQNSLQDYVRYNAFTTELSLIWDRVKWMNVNLTSALNFAWNQPNKFSQSSNLLKSFMNQLRVDIFAKPTLKLYSNFFYGITELRKSEFSYNYIWNIGALYDISKTLSIDCYANNLLNLRSYEEASYKANNYFYYYVPLRGREIFVALNFKF